MDAVNDQTDSFDASCWTVNVIQMMLTCQQIGLSIVKFEGQSDEFVRSTCATFPQICKLPLKRHFRYPSSERAGFKSQLRL